MNKVIEFKPKNVASQWAIRGTSDGEYCVDSVGQVALFDKKIDAVLEADELLADGVQCEVCVYTAPQKEPKATRTNNVVEFKRRQAGTQRTQHKKQFADCADDRAAE